MSENSPIEWTDHTFNPWWGCAKVSPGCDNCYAERLAARFKPRLQLWGTTKEGGLRFVFDDNHRKHWNEPLGWNRKAAARGVRERVFCASMADVFDNAPMDDERDELWTLIHKTPSLDWLLLTKRVGNVARMVRPSWMNGHWPANAWLGISVVNQEEADRDVPKLLAAPARVRFLSIEPMLGPIDLRAFILGKMAAIRRDLLPTGLHWIIAGGESGPGARPAHPDWFRSLRDQCADAGVPFLFKQWGEWGDEDDLFERADLTRCQLHDWGDRSFSPRVGKKVAGRLLDGVQHDGFPA